MRATKLNRMTLADQVAQAMVERIRRRELKPGDPLPSISVLAQDFGVSRPVIREALKTLEGREFIQISNGRSAYVKPVSSAILKSFFERAIALDQQTIVDLLELRRGVEIECASLAAQRRSPEELAEMQRIVAVMRQTLHDPNAYTEHDLELHFAIASATHNALLYYMIESVRDSLQDTIKHGMRSRTDAEQIERVQQLHEGIVEAIGRSDAEGAALAMAAHFDDAINVIVRASIPWSAE